MIEKIKRGASGLRDADMSVFAKRILEKMAGNSNFPTPEPKLVDVDASLQAYEIALAEAETRDIDATLAKNLRKAELKNLLGQLFEYVIVTGKGDIEILTSSGFPLAKERKPIGDMPKPENFKVKAGDGSGKVDLSIKRVHGADAYVYQYCITPNPEVENWTIVNDVRSRIKLSGLEPGTQYKFRVAAVGARGMGSWSDAITCYVA